MKKNNLVILYGGCGRLGSGFLDLILEKNIKVINIDPKSEEQRLASNNNYIPIKAEDIEQSKNLLRNNLLNLSASHNLIGVVNFSRLRIEKNGDNLSIKEEMNSKVYSVMLFNFIEIIDLLILENFINFSIVHIGSTNAKMVSHQSILYHSIKGAIESTNKAMAYKLASKNIRSNLVIPGIVKDQDDKSPISTNEKASIPLKRGAPTPRDIAKLIYFLISEDSKFITGSSVLIDGGISLSDSLTLLNRFNNLKNNE